MRDWGPILEAAERGHLAQVSVGQDPRAVAARFYGRMVYLATPYALEVVDSFGIWSCEKSRLIARKAARAANDLRAHGVSAFSPIVAAEAMIMATGLTDYPGGHARFHPAIDPLDGAMWMHWCLPFLAVSAAVVVPDIEGWDRSVGIKAEVDFAIERGLPVFLYGGP